MNTSKKSGSTTILALGAALLFFGAAASAHKGQAVKGKSSTLAGEVLDLSCYLGHGAKGKKHQECAKACLLDKHVPAGLLTKDGKVYLLVLDHQHEKALEKVGELAAEQVNVTGTQVKQGGLQAILVEKIEKK